MHGRQGIYVNPTLGRQNGISAANSVPNGQLPQRAGATGKSTIHIIRRRWDYVQLHTMITTIQDSTNKKWDHRRLSLPTTERPGTLGTEASITRMSRTRNKALVAAMHSKEPKRTDGNGNGRDGNGRNGNGRNGNGRDGRSETDTDLRKRKRRRWKRKRKRCLGKRKCQ
jgi:hypothetical protein